MTWSSIIYLRANPATFCFWDESLLVSEARSVSEIELESALGWLKPKLRLDKGESKRVSAFKYAEKCLKLFKEELDSQEKQARPAVPLYCPPLSPPEVKEFKEALGNNSILKCVKDLLEISENPLRVVNTDQSGGLSDMRLWFRLNLRTSSSWMPVSKSEGWSNWMKQSR